MLTLFLFLFFLSLSLTFTPATTKGMQNIRICSIAAANCYTCRRSIASAAGDRHLSEKFHYEELVGKGCRWNANGIFNSRTGPCIGSKQYNRIIDTIAGHAK